MKKIITVSYYADFSRFFGLAIDNISGNSIDWLNLCIYPSGYLYSLLHNQPSIYLPNAIGQHKENNYLINDELLRGLCKYHGTSQQVMDRAKKYLSYYDSIIDKEKPDLIILSGDSRLPVTTLSYIANKKGVKVVYFEQGPCSTTILDKAGVNANCSFRQSNDISDDTTAYDKAKSNKPKKWKGYKKYRLVDVVCGFAINKWFPELSKYKLPDLKKKKIQKKSIGNKNGFCLLILQVPEDANMLLHSPHFMNHYSLVKEVYYSLKKSQPNISLVVREHPLYIGKYEAELYDFIAKEDLILDSESNLYNEIKKSQLVIVNNSTVGLEVMALEKPLVVLGDSYYDNSMFVNKYNGSDLSSLISFAITNKNKVKLAKKRVNFLFEKEFITGHFRDLDKERFISISRLIENEVC